MKAVTAGHEIAIDTVFCAASVRVEHVWAVCIDILGRNTIHIMNDGPTHRVARVVKVFGHLRLAIDHHRGPGQILEIDPE